MEKLTPFIKWIGQLHMPYSRKLITGKEYYLYRDFLEEGDVILTKTYGEASNFINAGEMKHAAIYVGGGTVKYVIEAVGKGVIKTNLIDFMLTKDEIVILRPLNIAEYKIKEAITKATNYVGYQYDYMFSFINKSLYCAELVYECYQEFMEMDMGYLLDVAFVKPDHFLYDKINFEIKKDSRE
jgi:uncharacterized protein YycO